MTDRRLTRRTFVQGLAVGGAAAGLGLWPSAAWPQTTAGARPASLTGSDFDLAIGETALDVTGSPRRALTVNGSLPAPTLRWREGETVTVRVANRFHRVTSIHWHGILVPATMDGVPGLSYDGIRPGETFTYRFTVRQSGTYWYHSHSGFQEQRGLYGPLVIEPREQDPVQADREHVVMLSDWTDEDPGRVFAKLKKQSHYYNFHRRTVADFFRDVRDDGLEEAVSDRLAWGGMRMTPTDLADVSGYTYTYLMNGHAPAGNWTGLFEPGERVRLRLVNGAAMTYFDVRIPGLRMTVVSADGQPVHPVTVDELRIAVAETVDVVVEPTSDDAFTIFAQSMDRTGYARGTLATRPGVGAPVPPLDPRPLLTMADMGHGGMDHPNHGAMADAAAGAPQAAGGPPDAHSGHAGAGAAAVSDPHAGHGAEPSVASTEQDPHAGHAMRATTSGMVSHPPSERGNPLVDMQAMSPTSRLDDPGIGLRDNGRRVLTYADLHSLFDDPDGRDPGRVLELHLTGHMERFAWSFDGIKFADADALRLTYGERLRVVLVNDTMMSHPIHLHGLWSDVEDDTGAFHLRKHVVDMPPGTRRTFRVRADALGRWAFHCHLLYHMEAGMFREVRVDV
jgi:CopA family copper-resistance protein